MTKLATPANEFADDEIGRRLSDVLTRVYGEPTVVKSVKRFTVGFSWMTFGVVAERSRGASHLREQLVLRIGPPKGLFAPYLASPEFSVLKALHAKGLPVPAVHAFSDDPEPFGAPYLVAQHVPGTAPLPWATGAGGLFDPVLRETLAREFIGALAELHRFDWSRSDVSLPDLGETTLANAAIQQVKDWEAKLRRWQRRIQPVAEEGLAWLLEHSPVAPRISVIHGDYRVGNFLVHEGHLSAVLDWELVHLGDPHEDLAYMCQRAFGSKDESGTFRVCHMVSREELFDRYEAASGIPVNRRSIEYYELFNAWKLFVVHVGAAQCFEAGSFGDLRMPAMGAQIPRMLLQIDRHLEAMA